MARRELDGGRSITEAGLRRRQLRRRRALARVVQASPRLTRSGVIGRWRSRLPVSAATALAIAGATTGTPASPIPVGLLSVEITFTSMGGTSDIRMTRYS